MSTEAISRDSGAKVEVLAAYQELLGKLKATKKVARLDEEKEEIARREKTHIIEVMAQESPQDISRKLEEVKHLVNESLTEIGALLVSEQDRLVNIRQAVNMSSQELDRLYGIREAAVSLEDLLTLRQETRAAFEEEKSVKTSMLDRMLSEHKQAFESEIAQKRREIEQKEKDSIHQLDVSRERERAESEARLRHIEEKEAALEEKARVMQDEFRMSIEHERRRIEQEIQLKFEYEAKLLEKEMEGERKAFHQQIIALEAKIEHLESLKYSFNKLSFNSTPVQSID